MEKIDINKIDLYNYTLKTLYKYGHYPIGITTMMCENTFIFETENEAIKAHKELESEESIISKEEIVQGWWYSKEEWSDIHKEYIKEMYDNDIEKSPKIYRIKKGEFIEIPKINYKDITEIPEKNKKIAIILKKNDSDIDYHNEGYYDNDWFLFTGSSIMETYKKICKDKINHWYYLDELY
jgi:hypothetical protein